MASKSAGVSPASPCDAAISRISSMYRGDFAASPGHHRAGARHQLWVRALEVLEDVLEHALVAGRDERVRQQRDGALVHGGRRHLHGRSEPDLGAHDAHFEPRGGHSASSAARMPGEVDGRRPRAQRRRPRDGAVDEIEPSVVESRTVRGAIAFRSAKSGVTRALPAAAATSRATEPAAAGGTTETTASAAATTASRSGSSSTSALSASRRVRSLRSPAVATTRSPPWLHTRASALPIAPVETTAIVRITPRPYRVSAVGRARPRRNPRYAPPAGARSSVDRAADF